MTVGHFTRPTIGFFLLNPTMGWASHYIPILTTSQPDYEAVVGKEQKAKILADTVHKIKAKAKEDGQHLPDDIKTVRLLASLFLGLSNDILLFQ